MVFCAKAGLAAFCHALSTNLANACAIAEGFHLNLFRLLLLILSFNVVTLWNLLAILRRLMLYILFFLKY